MTKHWEMRYQTDYIAKLRESEGSCTEVVFYRGEQIHRAEFPSANLGTASRGEYLGCMVASVAREHSQKAKQAKQAQPRPDWEHSAQFMTEFDPSKAGPGLGE